MAKILIVEDSTVTQRVISHTLKKHGHDVLIANNGVEALAILPPGKIDLILMDLAMPEMDGLTLLSKLRQTPAYQQLPVIVLTASGDDEDRIRARQIGASNFLNKPVSSWDLIDAVNRVLGLK